MRAYVRVAVDSRSEREGTGAATRALERRLTEMVDRTDGWGSVRAVPRAGAPPAQWPVSDLLVELSRDHLGPDTVKLAVAYLVRAVIGHLRTQPDDSRTTTITVGDQSVVLRTEGMTPEEIAALEVVVATELARQSRGREE